MVVHFARKKRAFSGLREKMNLCIERQHNRRQIGRRHGPAARTARGNPTRIPILLQAEVNRLPPFVSLVVVVASGIDAEVPAERAIVLRGGLEMERAASATA